MIRTGQYRVNLNSPLNFEVSSKIEPDTQQRCLTKHIIQDFGQLWPSWTLYLIHSDHLQSAVIETIETNRFIVFTANWLWFGWLTMQSDFCNVMADTCSTIDDLNKIYYCYRNKCVLFLKLKDKYQQDVFNLIDVLGCTFMCLKSRHITQSSFEEICICIWPAVLYCNCDHYNSNGKIAMASWMPLQERDGVLSENKS